MLPGHATNAATTAWTQRRSGPGFHRSAQNLTVSSIGIGTYLGQKDAAADQRYIDAIVTAISGGINFIDTSLNYRHQRSERNIAAAIATVTASGEAEREALVVCTKAGYLVPGAVPAEALSQEDIVGDMHCMAPAFLKDQLERSRGNLQLETIDVFYLHNPETQLRYVGGEEFDRRLRKAFQTLEDQVDAGRIRFYGAATWDGFRTPPASANALSLVRMTELAREVAGGAHHFRFIQLPLNLSMTEALSLQRERIDQQDLTVLGAADRLGITVVASASILQARLASGLPEELRPVLGNEATDAQRAIQFTRSTPGITVALVGMSRASHVEENLGIRRTPPLSPDAFRQLFTRQPG